VKGADDLIYKIRAISAIEILLIVFFIENIFFSWSRSFKRDKNHSIPSPNGKPME